MIKVISFNVDGNLIDKTPFDDLFWFEVIPLEYSRIHKISLDKSKAIVEKVYKEISLFDPDWYRPEVWFKKLQIDPNEEVMVKNLIATFVPYRDAISAITHLYSMQTCKLIAVSNSSKRFLTFKFRAAGVQGCFQRVFSAVDDGHKVKHDVGIFREILISMGISAPELVHVGTDHHGDYEVPKALGIHAVLLDRNSVSKNEDVISSLTPLKGMVEGFNKQ